MSHVQRKACFSSPHPSTAVCSAQAVTLLYSLRELALPKINVVEHENNLQVPGCSRMSGTREVQLRCQGRLDCPVLQELALSKMGRLPESISKTATISGQHWPPNQSLLFSLYMQRIELGLDHLGTALTSSSLPASSPVTQAGEPYPTLIHLSQTTSVCTGLFCINLLLEVGKNTVFLKFATDPDKKVQHFTG